MSIRLIALYIFVAFLLIYAWKDWYKSLCGLILMMAIIESEDMPKTMFGIQGLNLWNVLFIGIVIAWLASRKREGLQWDMPRHIKILLLMYLGVIVIGFLRAAFDRTNIENYPLKSLISEELLNTIKWALPGILLFDGCRTRRRFAMALICILTFYLIIGIQVVRFMPPSAAFDLNSMSSLRVRLGRYIGYSACDISAMLSGASWAVLATLPLIQRKKYRVFILVAAGIITFGQALTGGRAGYVAWGVTGFTLCLLKWRKYLVLAPVVVILLPLVFPSATARFFVGFNQTDVEGNAAVNEDSMTSGRILMWPYVIDEIGKSPLIGYGRLAMSRTGLQNQLLEMGLSFPHPHNVYLETMLDNGFIGSLPIFIFWGMTLIYSAGFFRSKDPLFSAVGGVVFALTLAQLVAGMGAQHYFPRISTMGLWTASYLMFRIYVEEKRMKALTLNNEYFLDENLSQQYVVVDSAYLDKMNVPVINAEKLR